MDIALRSGRHADLPDLLAIYNHHVRTGVATFDEDEASTEEREQWFAGFSDAGPHQLLVAADDRDGVVGYASSRPYRAHPAFRATVETSIYLDPAAAGRGVGGRLYDELLTRLATTIADQALAGVALPNDASVALHRSRGFREVGTFSDYAVKSGRRISSTWFQRAV